MRALMIAGLAAAGLSLSTLAMASGGGEAKHHWSFQGFTGTFDRAALRRGSQVYREVCAGCHSLRYIYYRNLLSIGLSEEEVKRIASEVEVIDGPNDEGEMFERPGRPSDRFKSPFRNEKAARAANAGAFPPDLTLMVKARAGGADYMFNLLTGFREPPTGTKIAEGMNYNVAFPSKQIAMAPPLSEGAVEYADGTKATVEQMARDVTTFLAWTAEPELEVRKAMGLKVIGFLIILTLLLYGVKRKIWADVH